MINTESKPLEYFHDDFDVATEVLASPKVGPYATIEDNRERYLRHQSTGGRSSNPNNPN